MASAGCEAMETAGLQGLPDFYPIQKDSEQFLLGLPTHSVNRSLLLRHLIIRKIAHTLPEF